MRRPVDAAREVARRWFDPALRAEHAALKEEQRIAADLASLPAGWFVVPAKEVGVLAGVGGTADHFVIGPGGVFIIRVQHQSGARVWVSERTMTIDGRTSACLAEARFEARRTGGSLTESCGFAVTVQSVLVMIGATVQTVSRPAEVHVRGQHDLRDWLCLQPVRLDADSATALHARVASTDAPTDHAFGSSTTTGICRDVLR